MQQTIRYMPDGTLRCIYAEPSVISPKEIVPQRASHVESVADGPYRGCFYVDFTPLGTLTNREEFFVCLTKPFDLRSEALAAEVKWLNANYILEGIVDVVDEE